MTQLAKGTWPQLQRLVLTGNQLDETAIIAVIKGKWPLLTSLVLDANSSLSSAAIALLPRAANWASLSKLSLAHMHLDNSCCTQRRPVAQTATKPQLGLHMHQHSSPVTAHLPALATAAYFGADG